MFTMQTDNYTFRPALLVIDVQNGFVSKGGSYDKLGMDISNYSAVVPKIMELINLCRELGDSSFLYRGYMRTEWYRLIDQSSQNIAKIPGKKDKEGAHMCAWHRGCTNN